MSRRRIAWGVAANTYDRLLIAACQLVLVPVLARQWGPHLYGCWIVLATLPGFLALADLGFGSAAFVRMTTRVTQGDRAGAVETLHTACRMTALASAVVLVGGWAAIATIPAGWLPTDPALPPAAARGVLALLVLYALSVLQSGLQSWTLRSIEQFALGAFVAAHGYLLETLLVTLAAVTGHGPVLAAGGMVVGRLTTVGAQHVVLRRRAPWLRQGFRRATAGERRALLGPGLHALFIPLGQATVLQGSVAVLGAAAGPAATPAFAAARTLSRVGLQATQLLTHALMPEFTAAAARDDRPGQARMLLALLIAAALSTMPLALAIGLAGPWLVARWTHGAIVAPPTLMAVMAGSVLLTGAWTPLSNLMLAINRQAAFSTAYLLLGAGSLGLTYMLAGPLGFGATGAAIGVTALDAAMCVVIGRFAIAHWLRGLPLGDVARAAAGRLRRPRR